MICLGYEMKLKSGKNWLALSLLGLTSLVITTTQAAILDGQINAVSEYQWNTTTAPNSKWNTRGGVGEANDGSGGDPWDINYLGTNIGNGDFQFGAIGGSILTGSNAYRDTTLRLSDLAINVVGSGETASDPAADSSGWDYALKLISIDGSGNAEFSLHSLVNDIGDVVGSWQGSGTKASTGAYQHQRYSYGSTETFTMVGGYEVATGIVGKYSPNSADEGVLEGSFDLSLLSLFNEATGGRIITYLTMSCANDEAIVDANVSPVPLPSAVWLFGSALIGFIGMSRRTRV